MSEKPIQNGVNILHLRERIYSLSSEFFPLRMDPNLKQKRKQKVASAEHVLIFDSCLIFYLDRYTDALAILSPF